MTNATAASKAISKGLHGRKQEKRHERRARTASEGRKTRSLGGRVSSVCGPDGVSIKSGHCSLSYFFPRGQTFDVGMGNGPRVTEQGPRRCAALHLARCHEGPNQSNRAISRGE